MRNGRRPSIQHAMRQAWMRNTHLLIIQEIPDLETRKPADYWETLTFLFNQGEKPEKASRRMIEQMTK